MVLGWRTALGLAVLLAMPVAAASVLEENPLSADAVSGTGASRLQIPLVALWTGHGNEATFDGQGWVVEGEAIHVLRETTRGRVDTPASGFRTNPDLDEDNRNLEAATITVANLQPDSYVFVLGHEAMARLAGADLHVSAQGAGTVSELPKYPDQQDPLTASWQTAASASSQHATATIDGSFVIGVWGATLDVQHAGGNETWVSGRHNNQSIGPKDSIVVADETWIYIEVSAGTLTIPTRAIPEGSFIAASQGGSLSVDGSLQARGAVGEILGETLDGQDVLVSGSLQADGITAQDGRLAFALKGDADSYVLDGRLVAVSPAKEGISWLWSFAAIPVLAAWLVRRRQPARRVARLRDALGRGRFSGVVRRAPRFFGTPWDKEARIATAVAYLRLDAPDRAMDVLEEGDVPRGMTCFLRAHALAVMGQLLEARALLREALESAPHLRYEAERNPALAPLLSVGSTEAYA